MYKNICFILYNIITLQKNKGGFVYEQNKKMVSFRI